MVSQTKTVAAALRTSAFVRNLLVVMTGTAAAQVIGFALMPIISRLFSPNDFGALGGFNSVASIIAAGATLQYTQAIMLPRETKDAFNLFFLACMCTFAVSLILLAGCLLVPSKVTGLMKAEDTWILALLIAATVISGLNQSCQAWCVRVKAFRETSVSQVARSLSSNGTQLGFGSFGAGSTGLIISGVLADLVASINLVRVVGLDFFVNKAAIRWARMKELATEYRDFPLYSASQNVINAASSGLPVLLLTHFFGIAVAGAYTFGMRILSAPTGLVSTALRQVLFQKAAETQHQDGRLSVLYVRVTFGLFGAAFVPAVALLIWGRELFVVVFGKEWEAAGVFARSLILWQLFAFCNLPAVLFARLIRIQRTVFMYDIFLLIVRLVVLVIGGKYLTANYSVTLLAVVGAGMNLALVLLVGHAVMKKEGQVSWGELRAILTNKRLSSKVCDGNSSGGLGTG